MEKSTMKKYVAVALICVLIVATYQVGVTVGESSNETGSISDPLITESYLAKRISGIAGGSTSSNTTTANYKEVVVKSGKKITLDKGTEVVVYSGSGSVTAGTLVNLSSGTLFQSSNSLVKYNVLLATTASTKITTNSDTTVFIRGTYSVE